MSITTDKQLLITKIIVLFVLFFSSSLITFIPVLMNRWSWLKRHTKYMRMFIRIMNMFSGLFGGVLFAGALVHLIPDADERVSKAITQLSKGQHSHNETMNIMTLTSITGGEHNDTDHKWFVEYPWAALLCCCSFMTIYLFDKILIKYVMYCTHKLRAHKQQVKVHLNGPSINSEDLYHELNTDKTKEIEQDIVTSTQEEEDDNSNLGHYHDHHLDLQEINISSLLNALVLWFSLTAHGLFEALGLGAVSDMKQLWTLLIAILSHKIVEALILGMTIEKSFRSVTRMRWRHIISVILFVFTFSLATPAGVAIGMGVSQAGSSSAFNLVSGLFLALASGAFLYVALFEVLAHDHDQSDNGHSHGLTNPIWDFISYILFMIGIAVMAVMSGFHGSHE